MCTKIHVSTPFPAIGPKVTLSHKSQYSRKTLNIRLAEYSNLGYLLNRKGGRLLEYVMQSIAFGTMIKAFDPGTQQKFLVCYAITEYEPSITRVVGQY